MDGQFVRDRITQLRLLKNISERKMSLDLGHSASYIGSISSGRSLPSMEEFLYLCDYLGVTPAEFFQINDSDPPLRQKVIQRIYAMSEEDLRFLLELMERMK